MKKIIIKGDFDGDLDKLFETLRDVLEAKETPEERRLKERVDKAGERLEELTDGLLELDFPKTKEYLLEMEKYFNKCGDVAEETLSNIKKMMKEDKDKDEDLDYIDFVGDTTKNDR